MTAESASKLRLVFLDWNMPRIDLTTSSRAGGHNLLGRGGLEVFLSQYFTHFVCDLSNLIVVIHGAAMNR